MTVALLWVVVAIALWGLDKAKHVPQPRTFMAALRWPFDFVQATYQFGRYLITGR